MLSSLSMPAGADVDAVVTALGDRAVAADPGLAAALDLRRGSAARQMGAPQLTTCRTALPSSCGIDGAAWACGW